MKRETYKGTANAKSSKPRGKKSEKSFKKGGKKRSNYKEVEPKEEKRSDRFEGKGSRENNKGRKFAEKGTKEERTYKKYKTEKPREQNRETHVESDGLGDETFVVVGKNPVMEAIRAGQDIDKILILKDNTDHVLKKVTENAKKRNIIVNSVDKAKLEYLANGQVHQGIIALMAPFPFSTMDDILNNAKKKGRDPLIVILDHLTDPHNLGAIIRSANVCGVDGVIIPSRRSASLTAVSVKASSGAVLHTPIVKVTNLSQCMDELKKKGFWFMSADMKGRPYYKSDFKGSLAIIIGSEGTGVSPKVKKKCDFSVSIPIHGEIESLNASAAAAIIFAEAAKQRF